MNLKLMHKMQQRLNDLEVKAQGLENQISDLGSFKSIEDNLKKEKLEFDLKETLSRIDHISSANKRF